MSALPSKSHADILRLLGDVETLQQEEHAIIAKHQFEKLGTLFQKKEALLHALETANFALQDADERLTQAELQRMQAIETANETNKSLYVRELEAFRRDVLKRARKLHSQKKVKGAYNDSFEAPDERLGGELQDRG